MTAQVQIDQYQELMKRYNEIHHLGSIAQLLQWDQEVMMPREGGAQRAEQLAALQKVIHAHNTAPPIGEILATIDFNADWTDEQKADLREAKKTYDLATKVPADLVAEIARLEVLTTQSWVAARQSEEYDDFWPLFKSTLQRRREYADAIRGERCRYDALLDLYEPGETSANLRPLFAELRTQLRGILEKIQGSSHPTNPAALVTEYPEEKQRPFSEKVIQQMGYNLKAGRLDVSAHPFCTGTGGDVRITTRYNKNNFTEALFGCMHETGHALYEQGLNRERLPFPAGGAASLGIHESQSRMWENMIGRSEPFWEYFYPMLKEQFPTPFNNIAPDEFWRLINHVEKSFIRTEADEVTYNLHIIMRFEVEEQLLEDKLSIDDLPEYWNHQFQQDFGVTPTSLKQGCIQDIHWPAGIFGYFPTYALGNLYAAQFYNTMTQQLPVNELLSKGELLPIREWLREQIHQYGHTYAPGDLCKRVTGKPLSIQPMLSYLNEKYGKVYNFS